MKFETRGPGQSCQASAVTLTTLSLDTIWEAGEVEEKGGVKRGGGPAGLPTEVYIE